MAGDRLRSNARRVIVKARYVVLKRVGAHSVATHLHYIERDGVDRDGQKGRVYSAVNDEPDVAAFEKRSKDDRHQFRFIIAPEDAVAIEDLKTYTRHLMGRVETDLGTTLDWVAVDHWNTDNPHTHVVLRGRDASGDDLIIARRYIAHGMRQRACGLATEWLGERSIQEIQASLVRQVDQDRLTSLDRVLRSQERAGVVGPIFQNTHQQRGSRELLIGRLQRLTSMGLAQSVGVNRWSLRHDMEQTLQAMGERDDIIRTMQRALGSTQRELAAALGNDVNIGAVGCVVGKGFLDELSDRGYLVVDGIDGRGHFVRLPANSDLSGYPMGGIVQVRSNAEPRRADLTITAVSANRVYRADDHLRIARAESMAGIDPANLVQAHVRRLEALRRAGIVERLSEGVWRIPANLAQRGQQYDARHGHSTVVELRSHLSIQQQIGAIGATWLDHQLVSGGIAATCVGFGAEVRDALSKRVEFLVAEGMADRGAGKIVLVRNLLGKLRERELNAVGKAIGADTGLDYRSVGDGARVTGIYRRSVLLTSGRFAMLEDGIGFSLVPWRPVIEARTGQALTAVIRGSAVSWEFGRNRSLG